MWTRCAFVGSALMLAIMSVSSAGAAPCIAGAPNVCVIADRSASEVLVALTVPVGAAAEGPGQHGVAHYLEHLTFRDRTVETGEPSSGTVGIDRYGNAYTTPFATTYHWTVPPERGSEAIMRALAVLGPLDLSPAVAEQEREIVQREREQRLADPWSKRAGAIEAVLYGGTALERSLIGTAEEVEALSAEAALAFHAEYYDPEDAVLVVAGAVDHLTLAGAMVRGRTAAGIGTVAANAHRGGEGAGERPPGPPDVAARILASTPVAEHVVVSGPFGAPERTADALTIAPPDATTVAAADLIGAYLNSALPGSPRVALEKGGERVSDAVADDVREATFALRELAPGLVGTGVTLRLRPSVKTDRAEVALVDAWSAWNDEWSALRENGIPAEAFERMHTRAITDLDRQRDDAVASAWSLIGWLEAGADPSEWVEYPSILAALTLERTNAVLDTLGKPVRSVVTDALPAPTSFTIKPSSPLEGTWSNGGVAGTSRSEAFRHD